MINTNANMYTASELTVYALWQKPSETISSGTGKYMLMPDTAGGGFVANVSTGLLPITLAGASGSLSIQATD